MIFEVFSIEEGSMKSEFEVFYVSNGMNKTSQKTKVIAKDRDEAKKLVEARGNKVSAVVFQKTIF